MITIVKDKHGEFQQLNMLFPDGSLLKIHLGNHSDAKAAIIHGMQIFRKGGIPTFRLKTFQEYTDMANLIGAEETNHLFLHGEK